MRRPGLTIKDCYRILGVAPSSDLEEVKRTYRKKAFELHPDLNPHVAGASRQFQQLNEAYVLLIRQLAPDAAKASSQGTSDVRDTEQERQQDQQEKQKQERERLIREKVERERLAREKAEEERKAKAAQKEQERRIQKELEEKARLRREEETRQKLAQERRDRIRVEQEKQEQARLARKSEAARLAKEQSDAARLAKEQAEAQRLESHRRTYARNTYSRASSQGSPHGLGRPSSSSGVGQGETNNGEEQPLETREDLLRAILTDPFARRVYEDIYSEVHKNDSPASHSPQVKPVDSNESFLSKVPVFENLGSQLSTGVDAVKDWFRGQIDENQVVHMPATSLFPGAHIRLQIRQGFSKEMRTIEIVLPQDFVLGKAIRLKGMGKRLGNWQGDFYITFLAKA